MTLNKRPEEIDIKQPKIISKRKRRGLHPAVNGYRLKQRRKRFFQKIDQKASEKGAVIQKNFEEIYTYL